MPDTNQINNVGILRGYNEESIYVEEQDKTGYSCAVTGGNINVDSLPLPTNIASHTGSTTNAFSSSLDFGDTIKTLIVTVLTNGAIIQTSVDNSNWSDDFYVPANTVVGFDIAIRYIKIKSAITDEHASYYLNGLK